MNPRRTVSTCRLISDGSVFGIQIPIVAGPVSYPKRSAMCNTVMTGWGHPKWEMCSHKFLIEVWWNLHISIHPDCSWFIDNSLALRKWLTIFLLNSIMNGNCPKRQTSKENKYPWMRGCFVWNKWCLSSVVETWLRRLDCRGEHRLTHYLTKQTKQTKAN